MSLLVAALGFSMFYAPRPVMFRYESKQPLESVCIVGEFNEWDRARFLLTPDTTHTKWSGTFSIEPGGYNYLVCEDNKRWLPDPARKQVKDTNGNPLSRLVVFPEDFDHRPSRRKDGLLTTSAFQHFPDGRDTARLNTNRYYLRFRTRLGDAQTVSVDIGGSLFALAISRSDELYDYWQGEFTTEKQRLEYRFVVKDGEVSFRYPGDGSYFSQNRADFPMPDPPAWVRDAVFYQIFPDRFENGDRTNDPQDVQPWGTLPTATNRMGGDLKGIEKRLPYLKELGINAIYLNPIFHAVSNHGYDTIDYLKVDPRFGNVGDLRALVKAAHRLGIRVVLDAVFNHSSTQFFAFSDLVENGERSRYRDWFFPLRFPIQVGEGQKTYRTFAGVPSMPKFNTENPATADYLIRVGEYWIRECDIDGWRLDVADEVSPVFWRKFRTAIKKLKPECYILGEVWGDAHTYLQGDQHDGVMNYRWRRLIHEWLLDSNSSPATLIGGLDAIRRDYPDDVHETLLNVLSSHDTERMATRFKGDESAIRIAFALQFFLAGVPCVYYGDEIGLEGGHDPLCRGTMVWDQDKWNLGRKNWVHDLANLRRRRASLRSNSPARHIPLGRLLAIERSMGRERTRIYVNRSQSNEDVSLGPEFTTLVGHRIRKSAGKITVLPGGVAIVGSR